MTLVLTESSLVREVDDRPNYEVVLVVESMCAEGHIVLIQEGAPSGLWHMVQHDHSTKTLNPCGPVWAVAQSPSQVQKSVLPARLAVNMSAVGFLKFKARKGTSDTCGGGDYERV